MAGALSSNEASAALHILADAALDRNNDLSLYADATARPESDDEQDSPSPIFDSFTLVDDQRP